MLNNPWFYNRTTRNLVIVFGSLFNKIEVRKLDKDSRVEKQRQTVPISYASKETWTQRTFGDTDLNKPVQVTLPQMSFEITGFQYDATRKLSSQLKNRLCADGNTSSMFAPGIPWDVNMDLHLYIRNEEDGLQIFEQILPFFSPTYTVGMKYLTCDDCAVQENLPITLESVNYVNQYQGGKGDVRYINWTLSFNLKALFYGPYTSEASIIKEVITNLKDFNTGNTNATITVTPDPPTANSTDDYGFTTVIEEFG